MFNVTLFVALYGHALCLVFFIALVFNVTVVRCTLLTCAVFSVFHCTCVECNSCSLHFMNMRCV